MPNGLYALVCSGSIMLNVMANIAYVRALEVSDLSLTVPLLSLTPAVAAAFAALLLDEHLTLIQVIGVALVVLGALLLTTEHAPGHSLRGWLNAVRHDRGSAFMLLVAVCWSLTLPLDKVGVLVVGPSRHALISTAGVALATLVILILRKRGRSVLHPPRPALVTLTAAILVSALALGLQLVLLARLEVGVIDGTKRAIGNVMALVFGATIYRESVTWTKGISLATMAGGVFLILN